MINNANEFTKFNHIKSSHRDLLLGSHNQGYDFHQKSAIEQPRQSESKIKERQAGPRSSVKAKKPRTKKKFTLEVEEDEDGVKVKKMYEGGAFELISLNQDIAQQILAQLGTVDQETSPARNTPEKRNTVVASTQEASEPSRYPRKPSQRVGKMNNQDDVSAASKSQSPVKRHSLGQHQGSTMGIGRLDEFFKVMNDEERVLDTCDLTDTMTLPRGLKHTQEANQTEPIGGRESNLKSSTTIVSEKKFRSQKSPKTILERPRVSEPAVGVSRKIEYDTNLNLMGFVGTQDSSPNQYANLMVVASGDQASPKTKLAQKRDAYKAKLKKKVRVGKWYLHQSRSKEKLEALAAQNKPQVQRPAPEVRQVPKVVIGYSTDPQETCRSTKRLITRSPPQCPKREEYINPQPSFPLTLNQSQERFSPLRRSQFIKGSPTPINSARESEEDFENEKKSIQNQLLSSTGSPIRAKSKVAEKIVIRSPELVKSKNKNYDYGGVSGGYKQIDLSSRSHKLRQSESTKLVKLKNCLKSVKSRENLVNSSEGINLMQAPDCGSKFDLRNSDDSESMTQPFRLTTERERVVVGESCSPQRSDDKSQGETAMEQISCGASVKMLLKKIGEATERNREETPDLGSPIPHRTSTQLGQDESTHRTPLSPPCFENQSSIQFHNSKMDSTTQQTVSKARLRHSSSSRSPQLRYSRFKNYDFVNSRNEVNQSSSPNLRLSENKKKPCLAASPSLKETNACFVRRAAWPQNPEAMKLNSVPAKYQPRNKSRGNLDSNRGYYNQLSTISSNEGSMEKLGRLATTGLKEPPMSGFGTQDESGLLFGTQEADLERGSSQKKKRKSRSRKKKRGGKKGRNRRYGSSKSKRSKSNNTRSGRSRSRSNNSKGGQKASTGGSPKPLQLKKQQSSGSKLITTSSPRKAKQGQERTEVASEADTHKPSFTPEEINRASYIRNVYYQEDDYKNRSFSPKSQSGGSVVSGCQLNSTNNLDSTQKYLKLLNSHNQTSLQSSLAYGYSKDLMVQKETTPPPKSKPVIRMASRERAEYTKIGKTHKTPFLGTIESQSRDTVYQSTAFLTDTIPSCTDYGSMAEHKQRVHNIMAKLKTEVKTKLRESQHLANSNNRYNYDQLGASSPQSGANRGFTGTQIILGRYDYSSSIDKASVPSRQGGGHSMTSNLLQDPHMMTPEHRGGYSGVRLSQPSIGSDYYRNYQGSVDNSGNNNQTRLSQPNQPSHPHTSSSNVNAFKKNHRRPPINNQSKSRQDNNPFLTFKGEDEYTSSTSVRRLEKLQIKQTNGAGDSITNNTTNLFSRNSSFQSHQNSGDFINLSGSSPSCSNSKFDSGFQPSAGLARADKRGTLVKQKDNPRDSLADWRAPSPPQMRQIRYSSPPARNNETQGSHCFQKTEENKANCDQTTQGGLTCVDGSLGSPTLRGDMLGSRRTASPYTMSRNVIEGEKSINYERKRHIQASIERSKRTVDSLIQETKRRLHEAKMTFLADDVMKRPMLPVSSTLREAGPEEADSCSRNMGRRRNTGAYQHRQKQRRVEPYRRSTSPLGEFYDG